ncbi:hypothetical protein [Desulfosporosinus sp. Sb-LF]|uniref:hypothetical protein n=1 Tax=Desulfosporosinus sp. Sb-LF TaxID=2560027 RepID=UPI00107F8336|nr:hypothetical protein [Desulfosporosinus sp. Sb-LF]TGE31960.1 hypothetical protein E4K68_14840 [Desulfosporosinus sp. Sb-LF]
MKKLVIYILAILFLLSLTACNAKVPNDVQTNVTYSKEFSYLPAYGNMKLQNITQPDENGISSARYLIKNTTTDIVLNQYADILKKDGWAENWSYTKDKKPYSMVAQKDNHVTTLLPRQTDNDVVLIISSK